VHHSEHVSHAPILLPYYEKEKTADSEWGRDEKVSRAAYRLVNQPERHCVVKFDGMQALQFVVPLVERYEVQAEALEVYKRRLLRENGARPAANVDQLVLDGEREFLKRARDFLKAQCDDDFSSRPRRKLPRRSPVKS